MELRLFQLYPPGRHFFLFTLPALPHPDTYLQTELLCVGLSSDNHSRSSQQPLVLA